MPTGGGDAIEMDWKAKFIVQTIVLEFRKLTAIMGGVDSSSVHPAVEENKVALVDDHEGDAKLPKESHIFASSNTSTDYGEESNLFETSKSSSSSSSTRSKRKRVHNFDIHEADTAKHEKYHQIFELELKNQQLFEYKLLLEIGLLKEKRRRLGLCEEPQAVDPKNFENS